VVVKPLDGNHGRGVSINLTEDAQVEVAFHEAKAQSKSRGILVEQFVTGMDHRMLVVNGELVAVAKRVPGHVVGDGKHTIAELVDIVNSDPRRGIGHEKVLTNLELDNQAERLMAAAGHTAADRPAQGRNLLPALDRQPVDRRHGDRHDRCLPPRQQGHGRTHHQGRGS
jgi:cyanophycin synthetase